MDKEKKDEIFGSWKEIAAYLGRDKRTCQRWETELGLPVRRLAGKSRSRIHAYKAEIDDWLKKNSSAQLRRDERSDAAPEKKRTRKSAWLAAAALFLILGTTALVLWATRKGPPQDFRIDGARLIVLDPKGREIWDFDTRLADLRSEADYRTHFQTRRIASDDTRYLLPWLIIDDIDGDGDRETLFIPKTLSEKNEGPLICLDSKKTKKWDFPIGKKMTYGNTPFPSDSDVRGFNIDDLFGDGRKEIVLDSNSLNEYPNQVVVLSAKGQLQGEYWNSGQLSDFLIQDIDKDGRKDILLIGQNGEYGKSVLVVLDPLAIRGGSPQTQPKFICENLEKGTEKYYILLPNSELDNYPSIDQAKLEDMQQGDFYNYWILPSGVIYKFGRNMELIDPRISDSFGNLYAERFFQGRLKNPYDPIRIAKELRANIRYWDGERWIATATKTKFWRDREPTKN